MARCGHRIALTGGIACGKSLVAKFLNEFGIETLDADDIVHEIIPAEERVRLAAKVFADPAARKELEARIHPIVRSRINQWLATDGSLRLAIIPLLFETHWDVEYDTILCVTSAQSKQIERMMTTRGYMREEAEARLAVQWPVAEKAAKSHYVITNDGTPGELREKVAELATWLKSRLA